MHKPLIATPTMDYKLCLNYHESVLKLALDRSRPDVALCFQSLPGMSPVHWAPNFLVEYALEGPYTHLFFIDADVGFEPEDVFAFLDADLVVVCGNYPLKEDGMGTVLPQSESTERFVPVPMAPAGFMCIKRNVLETMRERLPELSLTR